MSDHTNGANPELGLKREMEVDQLEDINTVNSTEEQHSATKTNEETTGEDNLQEPASKRIKLDQSEQTPRVDARDKVKGVALIKPE